MKVSKKILTAFLGVVLISSGFYSLKILADESLNKDFTPQRKLSIEEIKEKERSIDLIHTKYGVFKRSETEIETTRVAYDLDNIDSDTEEVIVDYGIFVKQ
ncbi:hypothetical protein G8C92_11890 [Paenibacillus donghaensis]|uniref:hypothetical protein n=1 Tax=Paenibacillus donghaensis TaxID=414771 RepID=UPI0018831345|nr:hypothetical protein [Paenibacillus donghaensis]MBE9914735.1 hypothetical protein [Paenibacillus donghaensis]